MTTLQKIDITDNFGKVHTIQHVRRLICHSNNDITVIFYDGSTDKWHHDEFREWWASEEDVTLEEIYNKNERRHYGNRL